MVKRNSFYSSRRPESTAGVKGRQSAKIREIADALISEGFRTLDAQAKALGLSRSTTWTILKGNHKSTGLSAKTINRLLLQRLPPLVRAKILVYVEEKASGRYGHSAKIRRKFITALSTKRIEEARKARTLKVESTVDREPINGASYGGPSAVERDTKPVDSSHKVPRSGREV